MERNRLARLLLGDNTSIKEGDYLVFKNGQLWHYCDNEASLKLVDFIQRESSRERVRRELSEFGVSAYGAYIFIDRIKINKHQTS